MKEVKETKTFRLDSVDTTTLDKVHWNRSEALRMILRFIRNNKLIRQVKKSK